MTSTTRSALRAWIGALNLACACGPSLAWAQRPGEIPNPATYEGSQALQRQYDQQQQQGREQLQRQQQQADQQWQDTLRQQQAQQSAAAAQGQAVLRSWRARPPLAPERNPLLGRWMSQGAAPADAKKLGGGGTLSRLLGPEMAGMTSALLGGMTAGLCDSMLGRGLLEFRPTALVAIGPDGREHLKYRLQYRGGGSRVVVLPQDGASFTHMIVDFDSPDRVSVAAVGCVMVRAGAPAATASRR